MSLLTRRQSWRRQSRRSQRPTFLCENAPKAAVLGSSTSTIHSPPKLHCEPVSTLSSRDEDCSEATSSLSPEKTASSKERNLKFHPIVDVYYVPTRSESCDRLDVLYWRPQDYHVFKQEAMTEIREYHRRTGSSPREAIVALYQPEVAHEPRPLPLSAPCPESEHMFGRLVSVLDYEASIARGEALGILERVPRRRCSSADSFLAPCTSPKINQPRDSYHHLQTQQQPQQQQQQQKQQPEQQQQQQQNYRMQQRMGECQETHPLLLSLRDSIFESDPDSSLLCRSDSSGDQGIMVEIYEAAGEEGEKGVDPSPGLHMSWGSYSSDICSSSDVEEEHGRVSPGHFDGH